MIESSSGILTGSWKSCIHLVKMGEHLSGHQNERKHFCYLENPTWLLLSWFSCASKLLILHPDAVTCGLRAVLWHETKKTLREWWTGTTPPRAPHLNNEATHERQLCTLLLEQLAWGSLMFRTEPLSLWGLSVFRGTKGQFASCPESWSTVILETHKA